MSDLLIILKLEREVFFLASLHNLKIEKNEMVLISVDRHNRGWIEASEFGECSFRLVKT